MTPLKLAEAIIIAVADDELVGAVLDDGEESERAS